MQNSQRSRLMRLSWEVQKHRKSNRSKALLSAWTIFLNEDITIYYLVQKHSTAQNAGKVKSQHLTLFNHY